MPLLLLHAELPLLCDFHVVIPKPDEVLSVAPVARENFLAHGWLLSVGYVMIYVPVFLAVNVQVMQPTALDVAYLFDHILKLLHFSYLVGVFSIEKLDASIRVLDRITLIDHSRELVFAPALGLPPEPSLFIGGE